MISEDKPRRQRHPIITGCFMMALVGLFFLVAVSLLAGSLFRGLGLDPLASTPKKEGVGVLEVNGVISASDELLAQLAKFAEDDKIRAVLIRLDSPGGSVGASQELFSEIKRVSSVKPVVASVGSIAASGALYAALGADKIIANPGAITGSIGVFIKIPNLEKLLERIGYSSETVKSAEMKDTTAFDRSLGPKEKAFLQKMVDDMHAQFVEVVADSRGLSREKVESIADGRVFSAKKALELRLIDGLGNLHDAAMVAAELAGMDADSLPTLVYPKKERFSLLSFLLGSMGVDMRIPSPVSLYPVPSYEWTIKP